MMIEGAVKAQVFDHYVERLLLPGLRPGDVVFLDNVRFMRAAGRPD